MSCFRKKHLGKVHSIVTEIIILDKMDVEEGKPLPRYFFTNNAMWDTGSEVTIVTQKIIDQLGISPMYFGEMSGIGGDQIAGAFQVQIALPNGDYLKDAIVFCGEIPDYDVIIGMDIISKLDFLITNKNDTVFSFRYPSAGEIELD